MGLFIIIIAIVVIILQLIFTKKPRTKEHVLRIILLNYLVFIIGVSGIFGFLGHTFMAAEIAESIGWQPGSPFQFEVAGANLAVGVAGILCIWFKDKFWLATILINGIFLWVAAVGHIRQIITAHDYAPNNAGFILYTDIIFPIVGIILYILYQKALKTQTA